MATADAAKLVNALGKRIAKHTKALLSNKEGVEFVRSLSAAHATVDDVKDQLGWLFSQCKRLNVVCAEYVTLNWSSRRTCSPTAVTLCALCSDLEEAISWESAAAWGKAVAADDDDPVEVIVFDSSSDESEFESVVESEEDVVFLDASDDDDEVVILDASEEAEDPQGASAGHAPMDATTGAESVPPAAAAPDIRDAQLARQQRQIEDLMKQLEKLRVQNDGLKQKMVALKAKQSAKGTAGIESAARARAGKQRKRELESKATKLDAQVATKAPRAMDHLEIALLPMAPPLKRFISAGAAREALEAIVSALGDGDGKRALSLARGVGQPLHALGQLHGLSIIHAASCSDAGAGVLAFALRQAASEGVDVRHLDSGAETRKSPLSRPSKWAQSKAAPLQLGSGSGPLDFAALHGSCECASILLLAGANPNHRQSRPCREDTACALDIASACGHVSVMRVLISSGADVNARSAHRYTPLHWAGEYLAVSAVQLLLQQNADPDAEDSNLRTPLDWAIGSVNGHAKPQGRAADVSDGHDDSIAILVELVKAGAQLGVPEDLRADVVIQQDASQRISYKRTLLHAVSNGLTAGSAIVLRRLLSQNTTLDLDVGADGANGMGGSPLHRAAHVGWTEGALLLLNAGANVDSADEHGGTPLITAARWLPPSGGCADMLRLLALKGAHLDARDGQGFTAAHWAASCGNSNALRTLASLGACMDLSGDNGSTPLQLAQRGQHGACVDLLTALEKSVKACPPRRARLGEDITCGLEEVDICADSNVVLPESLVFIRAHSVESAGIGSQLRPASTVAQMQKSACCDCRLLCIPGVCRCLNASNLSKGSELDVAYSGDAQGNELRIKECVSALDAGNCSIAGAIAMLLDAHDESDCKYLAAALHLASQRDRYSCKNTVMALRIGCVALLAALTALPGILPFRARMVAAWNARVEALVEELDKGNQMNCELFVSLLLELDDDVAQKLAASLKNKPRKQPLWSTRQSTAWLDHARPCWRAHLRCSGHTLDGLVGAMRDFALCLRSIDQPLRIGGSMTIGSITLCGPRCKCAAAGCRSTGVQYPLRLRNKESCGSGVYAETKIPAGAPIFPYVGELINDVEADERFKQATQAGDTSYYFLDLSTRAWSHLKRKQKPAVVDSRNVGNVARFCNHACKANLRKAVMDWPELECGPLLVLCAAEDIQPGQQLTWDYFDGSKSEKGFECCCATCKERSRESRRQ